MLIKFYCHYFIYGYNFACLLFWTTSKLKNDKKNHLNFKTEGYTGEDF